MNHELPDVQAGFRKGRGTRDQIANIRWITEKASSSLITKPISLPEPVPTCPAFPLSLLCVSLSFSVTAFLHLSPSLSSKVSP